MEKDDGKGVMGYEEIDKVLDDVMQKTMALEYMIDCMLQKAESAPNGGFA